MINRLMIASDFLFDMEFFVKLQNQSLLFGFGIVVLIFMTIIIGMVSLPDFIMKLLLLCLVQGFIIFPIRVLFVNKFEEICVLLGFRMSNRVARFLILLVLFVLSE